MSSTNHSAPETPGEQPLSVDALRAHEDALTSSLVEAFVQTRMSQGALDAFEITTLAAASALVRDQTDRLDGRSSRAEIPQRTMVAELAAASRSSERTIRHRMDDAVDLCARFPDTVGALRAGRISRAHVGVIHEAGHAIDDPDARADFERVAIARAEAVTAGRLRPIVQVLAARANPRTTDERHAAAREDRAVRVVDLADGMAELVATLPATLARGIHDRLTQQAHAVIDARAQAAPGCGGAVGNFVDTGALASEACAANEDLRADPPTAAESDARSMDELRADIFADLLLTGTPHSCVAGDGLAAIRATVQITVPVLTAAGRGTEPPLLVGHGPIDTETARRLAGDAEGWERVMTSPVTGAVLAVDRYRPGKDLRRFLSARDEHCRFPGCRIPFWRCDIDHTHDAALGGETSEANLAHLCRGHHVLKHASEWRVRQLGAGVLEWVSPTGRTYVDRPEPTLRFVPGPEPMPDLAHGASGRSDLAAHDRRRSAAVLGAVGAMSAGPVRQERSRRGSARGG